MDRVLLKELSAFNQTNASWNGVGEQLQTAYVGSLFGSELFWSCVLVRSRRSPRHRAPFTVQ